MSLFGIVELFKRERSKFTVVNDPFDVGYFEELLPTCQPLVRTIKQGTGKLPTFDSLTMDLFSILFKSAPQLQEPRLLRRAYRQNRKMVELLMSTAQYQELRQYTTGNEFDSILATQTLAEMAIQILEKSSKNQSQMDQMENQSQQKQQQLGQMRKQYHQQFGKNSSQQQGGQSQQQGQNQGSGGTPPPRPPAQPRKDKDQDQSQEQSQNQGQSQQQGSSQQQEQQSQEQSSQEQGQNQEQQQSQGQDQQEESQEQQQQDQEQQQNAQGIDQLPNQQDPGKMQGTPEGYDNTPDPELQRQKREMEDIMEQIEHEINDLESKMDDLSNELDEQEMRQQMRIAVTRALNDTQEISECLSTWGTADGAVQYMDYQQRMALAEKLRTNPKLMKLAKMLGRFKRWAISSNKTKIKHEISEIAQLNMDDDLTKIVPSELIRLDDEFTELLFIRDYLEGNLLCYDLKQKMKEQEGPIIVCVDESGSMGGDKELWSKAVVVAIAELAKNKKRNFAVIQFSSRNQVRVHKFERGQIPPEALIDIASHFYNGGTDFEAPLTAAMNIIDEQQFQKADVLFITDGECYVSDQWLKDFKDLKKKKDFRLTSVCVDFGYSSDGTVNKLSDEVI